MISHGGVYDDRILFPVFDTASITLDREQTIPNRGESEF